MDGNGTLRETISFGPPVTFIGRVATKRASCRILGTHEILLDTKKHCLNQISASSECFEKYLPDNIYMRNALSYGL